MPSTLEHLGSVTHSVSGPADLQPIVAPPRPQAILSVDVEDWFHILDTPAAPSEEAWDSLPSLIETNFYRLLNLFSQKHAQVTCFFLGWVAKRFPHLVREAVACGHEIASHGYSHRLVYRMTPQEFYDDALRARLILEHTAGCAVHGYRSPGFSNTEETPWFFERLAAAGYRYDSSVFPAKHGHGGLRNASRAPYIVDQNTRMVEFPITVADVWGKPMCFFGGGYLRLFPYWLVRNMARRVLAGGGPVVFYVHPREIDPHQPRLPMKVARQFKCYVNLKTTETKINRILDDFSVTSFQRFLICHLSKPVLPRPFSEGFRTACQDWVRAA